ncbi:MAG: Na+/H+ antiporter NhaA [Alphaproteobacteria bacterium]|nr:Na+/H+ antiporter NhaA [Alphaproteobacteria bacterium]NCQ67271.1 Na+/H+ antiporter NhaA [Alphaproteobacteria bacterium]NCT06762.1 Na+/H+ antiporter NhaA [Alphaproteobacteria bacterium]
MFIQKQIQYLREFFRLEAAGGILLGCAAFLALLMENSPLASLYNAFLEIPVTIQIGALLINKPLLLWINDALMAVFFFLIGLELKREILDGQLSSRDQLALPIFAALGGILVPALIYFAFNSDDPTAIKGWAIPAATDIAFALGVLTLLGKRVPESLKIALVAIAILDDLAAIVIIAFFYTDTLSLLSLSIGSVTLGVLATLNFKNVQRTAVYIITGIVLWTCVLKSGVHATLAGVVLALFIPLKPASKDGKSLAKNIEYKLHPWVAYGVLPIFAFANSGVSLQGLNMNYLAHPITLGVFFGLFVGKQIGITLFTKIGCALKMLQLPKGSSWLQYYGMSLLTGIGFTMSLFIGTLAFEDPEHQRYVRLGVLSASILSGVLGFLLLRFCKASSYGDPSVLQS